MLIQYIVRSMTRILSLGMECERFWVLCDFCANVVYLLICRQPTRVRHAQLLRKYALLVVANKFIYPVLDWKSDRCRKSIDTRHICTMHSEP